MRKLGGACGVERFPIVEDNCIVKTGDDVSNIGHRLLSSYSLCRKRVKHVHRQSQSLFLKYFLSLALAALPWKSKEVELRELPPHPDNAQCSSLFHSLVYLTTFQLEYQIQAPFVGDAILGQVPKIFHLLPLIDKPLLVRWYSLNLVYMTFGFKDFCVRIHIDVKDFPRQCLDKDLPWLWIFGHNLLRLSLIVQGGVVDR